MYSVLFKIHLDIHFHDSAGNIALYSSFDLVDNPELVSSAKIKIFVFSLYFLEFLGIRDC